MMTFLNKHKCLIFSFIIFFWVSKDIQAQKLNNSSELVILYKEYRIVQQKKTIWVDSIDNWTGKFHNIMSLLNDTLNKAKYTKKEIIKLLGEPDEIISKSTKSRTAELYSTINYKPISNLGKKEEYLIYKWRGYRDFLYFLVKNDRVKCAEWYYSWE